jgi:transcriptional regulator with XRE-family HTH domain
MANPRNLRKILQKNVLRIRTMLGLGQVELADKAGLATTTIQGIEYATSSIMVDTLDKLAKALGVPAFELLQDPDLNEFRQTIERADNKSDHRSRVEYMSKEELWKKLSQPDWDSDLFLEFLGRHQEATPAQRAYAFAVLANLPDLAEAVTRLVETKQDSRKTR